MDASSLAARPSPSLNYLISCHPTSASSPSSSSSVESFDYFSDDSPLTPTPPLRFSGVPFSWERTPGVPKNKLLQICHKKKDSMNLLPLPPPASRTCSSMCEDVRLRRNWFSSRKDPFAAAFVECSKGRDRGGGRDQSKTRSVGDRFGLLDLNVISCKKTCGVVSESVVYLPKPRRTPYGLITHHS